MRFIVPAVLLAALVTSAGAAPRAAPRSRAARAALPRIVPIDARGIQALAARPGARVTLVNVWATWCIPCRREFPGLLRVARARSAHGLRLVLVSSDFPEQWPAARRFLAAHGVSGTSWVKNESDMPFIDALDRRWTGALPATFVYDGAGHLAAFWEGVREEAVIAAAVDSVLSRSPEEEHP
ncbi:MAG TPA: TlpA disulfide reductase family protein [Candidatus Eisenbacteria bacterium]|nr:TlpA disulfide reductase family protein [Candidatus Eisenbacteria bacterium]